MADLGQIDTIIHATLDKSRKKLALAQSRAHPLQAWAMSTKQVEYEDGGAKISNPMLVGRNPNVGTTSYYGKIPVGQTSEFATVEYGWTRFVATVIISKQEEDENQGDTVIFKILKGKMKVLEESIKEKFSEYLYGAGAGNDPNGLANLIPDNPNIGTLAGVNRAEHSWWRTSAYNYEGKLNATNIEEAFDDMFLDLTQNSEKPDIIICGLNIFRDYRTAVRNKVGIQLTDLTNGKRMADLGFVGFTHQNVPMIYDENCPVNKAFFINSKHLKLHVLKHVNMRAEKLNSPWDMDARGSRTVWQGQWCLWKAYRTHSVLINDPV